MQEMRQIEYALLTYWKGYPNAVESLEDIARLWLPQAPLEQIEAALKRLVRAGRVEVVPKKNRPPMYRYRKASEGAD